jgi:hypothetical protein
MPNFRHEKDQSCDICAEKQISEDKSTSKTSIEKHYRNWMRWILVDRDKT